MELEGTTKGDIPCTGAALEGATALPPKLEVFHIRRKLSQQEHSSRQFQDHSCGPALQFRGIPHCRAGSSVFGNLVIDPRHLDLGPIHLVLCEGHTLQARIYTFLRLANFSFLFFSAAVPPFMQITMAQTILRCWSLGDKSPRLRCLEKRAQLDLQKEESVMR